MTQILSVITRDYALLASDRMLTDINSRELSNSECKIVNLCNVSGIGYTGLARIGNIPTHEWIAIKLAEAECDDPAHASKVLSEEATRALAKVPPQFARVAFLMSGWAQFNVPEGFRSHFCIISNCLSQDGTVLESANSRFDIRLRALYDQENFLWTSVGHPVGNDRVQALERSVRRLVAREIGPNAALRYLVDEIVYTSRDPSAGVGNKVLAFSIPRGCAERGENVMLSKPPDLETVSFAYFEPGYEDLVQYGPTFVCGGSAITDVRTENDPSREFQSSEMRILRFSKSKGATIGPVVRYSKGGSREPTDKQ